MGRTVLRTSPKKVSSTFIKLILGADFSQLEKKVPEIKKIDGPYSPELAMALGVVSSVMSYIGIKELSINDVFDPKHNLWNELYHSANYKDLCIYLDAMKNLSELEDVREYLLRQLKEDFR